MMWKQANRAFAGFLLSIIFTAQGRTAPSCTQALQSQINTKTIVSGGRTVHYYSGFGSSYGRNPIDQLRGYLEIGARLSPRAWDLLQKIRIEVDPSLTDKELARILVKALQPALLNSPSQIEELRRELQNDKVLKLILNELESINQDIQIFKSNSADVFELFRSIDRFYHKHKNTDWFLKSRRELRAFCKTAGFRKYSSNYIPLFRQRWVESFAPPDPEQIEKWRHDLRDAEQNMDYLKLTDASKDLLNRQLQRKAAGLFYNNYGGLYNRKDRSLIWYAAGENHFSRESFESIQTYFAKDGITFEFKTESQHRILWEQTLSLERRHEAPDVLREGLTYDVVSTSGNLIPEDLSRVYTTTPERRQEVIALFKEFMSPKELEQSGITFHLASDQERLHTQDTNNLLSAAELGSDSYPSVKPVVLGSSTFFLSAQEIQSIAQRQRPLKYLVALKDQNRGLDSLKSLIRRHSQSDSKTPVQNARVFKGGFWKSQNSTPAYLNPAEEVRTFESSGNIFLEIRPEVSIEDLEAMVSNGFLTDFDFRIVSNIYFPDPTTADEGRIFYFDHFGVMNLYKWSQKFDSTHNLINNYENDWVDFTAATSRTLRTLNLDKAHLFDLDLSGLKNKVNLFNINEMKKIREFLNSSQNFGLPPYIDLKTTMKDHEYRIWTQLQNLVLEKAKLRVPLSIELVDDFLLLAAQATTKHAPVGYRVSPEAHQIWPGGRKLGHLWSFNLQESQHFFREPFFELPDTVFRSSPTELIVDKLSYRPPGDMRDQIVLLIEKYNTVKQLYSSELSAFLFYKDLIALHPITDGNGRGCRALLSYLLLSEGIPSPSFERISMADLYVTGPESVQFLEMGVWRGWQSINFGGPPKN